MIKTTEGLRSLNTLIYWYKKIHHILYEYGFLKTYHLLIWSKMLKNKIMIKDNFFLFLKRG